jgi:hypothetical protein
MVTAPYEALLHQAGFPLAIGPLREWFELECIVDERLQIALAVDVVERTALALALLARPRSLH